MTIRHVNILQLIISIVTNQSAGLYTHRCATMVCFIANMRFIGIFIGLFSLIMSTVSSSVLSSDQFLQIMRGVEEIAGDTNTEKTMPKLIKVEEKDEQASKFATHVAATEYFKSMSKYILKTKHKKVNSNNFKKLDFSCSVCKYVVNSVVKYIESSKHTWGEWENIDDRRRHMINLIHRQACYPLITKRVARIIYSPKNGKKKLRYLNFDNLMHVKISGNEDVETTVSDEELSHLVGGCNFIEEHLGSIITDVYITKVEESLEEILCFDVIKTCGHDSTTEEIKRRRALKKKLNEEGDKRLLQTGKRIRSIGG